MRKLDNDIAKKETINMQFIEFYYARRLSSMKVIDCTKAIFPTKWWETCGDECLL